MQNTHTHTHENNLRTAKIIELLNKVMKNRENCTEISVSNHN